jgi:hypothetical protein
MATPPPNPTPDVVRSDPAPSGLTAPLPAPLPSKHYQRVLHAGDSLTGALGVALGKRFRAEGVEYHKDVWVSVPISVFDRRPRFSNLLTRYDPDLVLITLGANDADAPHPEALIPHVKRIVQRIGARDCIWIGPAMWKKDTGIVDIIARECAPCRFYDSRGLSLARKDGIHPTPEGGEVWAERFWHYFMTGDAGPSRMAADAVAKPEETIPVTSSAP